MAGLLKGNDLTVEMRARAARILPLFRDTQPLVAAELSIAYIDGATAALKDEIFRIQGDARSQALPDPKG